MHDKEQLIESNDLFQGRCSICNAETTIKPRHTVYTANRDIRFEQNPMTSFREGVRTTTYKWFQKHPCRTCQNCENKKLIRAGIVLGVAIIGLGFYYFQRRFLLTHWELWPLLRPAVVALIASAFIIAQLDERFGTEAVAKKRAAEIRGKAFSGLSSYEFDDIKKSFIVGD